MLYDVYDEQVDVTSRAFLGISISCARCHNHKFDPISAKDYYSLIAIFAGTKNFSEYKTMVAKIYFPPLVSAHEYENYLAHKNKVFLKAEERDKIIDQEIDRLDEPRFAHLADYMVAARSVNPDGSAAADVAKEKGLEPEILERWVKYLTPKAEARPYLDEWNGATADKLRPVAEKLQAETKERLSAWKKTLREWQKTMRERLKDRPHMPPPAKPKIEAAKQPFFNDVYSGEGPFALPENDLENLFSSEARERLAQVRNEYKQLEDTTPPEIDLACAVVEGERAKQYVFIRGDHHSPGEEVSPRFPFILTGSEQPPAIKGSGRLEFAQWLTRPDHPLTARVMANRIWHWHFGEGLVRTPNDFGKMGDRPTHPELLDYLARRFVEGGWSVKKLHRLIMLSSTYQMSSRGAPEAIEKDPEDRLWSRFAPRRLDIEEIRDGLLAIDGSLDVKMGGTLLDFTSYTDTENSEDRLSLDPEKTPRRMVYLPLRRANLPPLLNMFDFGDATTSLGKRNATNVAPQALFMMNSHFIAERSKKLADSLLASKNLDDSRRIQKAYLRILNRRANPAEVSEGLAYVAGFQKRFPGEATHVKGWQSYFWTLIASNEFLFLE
jgi:cytochrome c553